MPLIRIAKSPKRYHKINEYEFNITKLFIDTLGIDYETDYSLSYDCMPITCGDRIVGYCENYIQLNHIPKNLMIFRPLKNEKHSNILIDMFDELNIIESNNLEITENIKNGKKRYTGYFKNGHDIIDESVVTDAQTVPILKLSMIAIMLFDDIEYKIFRNNLSKYLNKKHR